MCLIGVEKEHKFCKNVKGENVVLLLHGDLVTFNATNFLLWFSKQIEIPFTRVYINSLFQSSITVGIVLEDQTGSPSKEYVTKLIGMYTSSDQKLSAGEYVVESIVHPPVSLYTHQSGGLSAGQIVGIVFGVIGGIVVLAFLVRCGIKKMYFNKSNHEDNYSNLLEMNTIRKQDEEI